MNQRVADQAERPSDIFTAGYLTVASIIQGVALAALVQQLDAKQSSLDATSWVLTATTFMVIVVIWHEYLMMVLGYFWIPGLVDSVVPFAFAAGELFMAHFVVGNTRAWLLAYGATLAVGMTAWFVTRRQVSLHRDKNLDVLDTVGGQRLRVTLSAILTVLALGGGLFYSWTGLQRAPLMVAVAALAAALAYSVCSVPYWSQIRAQLQTTSRIVSMPTE